MEEKSGKQVKAKTEQTGIPIEQTFIEGDQWEKRATHYGGSAMGGISPSKMDGAS
jgi:hypothetical protein